jgi:hypothetical protein
MALPDCHRPRTSSCLEDSEVKQHTMSAYSLQLLPNFVVLQSNIRAASVMQRCKQLQHMAKHEVQEHYITFFLVSLHYH